MKKILIMEDDRKIAAALAIRLEAAGYEVLTAPDGFRGLKLALNDRPDLLLMDIWMPVGTGFSVAQRLQSLGLTGIPIIFITASKLKGLRESARELGAVGFFEKPYDPQQLLAAVAQALAPKPVAGGSELVATENRESQLLA
jgi:CheY-like chemotaxis protein